MVDLFLNNGTINVSCLADTHGTTVDGIWGVRLCLCNMMVYSGVTQIDIIGSVMADGCSIVIDQCLLASTG